jgi:hypothetical protein
MVVHMNDQQPLREATVQDIQLELIRRHRYNEFDGQRVYDFLIKHRDLWQAVIMDRLGYVMKDDTGANWGLIKLRDLPANRWNVDTLIVMTDSIGTAEQLARLLDEADLGGEKAVVEDPDKTCAALGMYPCGHGLVSVWWD